MDSMTALWKDSKSTIAIGRDLGNGLPRSGSILRLRAHDLGAIPLRLSDRPGQGQRRCRGPWAWGPLSGTSGHEEAARQKTLEIGALALGLLGMWAPSRCRNALRAPHVITYCRFLQLPPPILLAP